MIEETFEGGNKIIRDRATDATVGQFYDPVFRAALDAAALQNLAVDTDVAEFIDDHRKAAPTGIFKNMANERCLAGAEEARDDGAGNFGKRCHRKLPSNFWSLDRERRNSRNRVLADVDGALAPDRQALGMGM